VTRPETAALRVLSIGSLFPPHGFGGYEVIWQSCVRELRARGHRVVVLASDHRHRDDVGGDDDPEVRRELRWYWRDGAWPAIGLRERVAIERHNAAVLRRHLRALRPDVVLWSEMGGMSLSLVEQVRRADVPALGIVLDRWPVYGPTVDAWTRAWRRRPRLGRLAEAVARIPARPDLEQAAEWSFCSTFLRDDVVRNAGMGGARTTVTHPGIDPELFTWHEPGPWRSALAYVGRVVPEKGLATAIRAVAGIPDATLAISGPGEARHLAELREQARRLGAAERVSFGGPVERDRVADAYAAADAVIFPVEWDEPFGLVPLEAMAVGRPVIATGTGGSGEYLRHQENALLFPPGDAEALAAAVARLTDDAPLRERIREQGRATAARHTDDAYNAAVADALERVASEVPARASQNLAAERVRALAERAGWLLSAAGQRLGVGWLTYNPVVIGWYHARAVNDASAVIDALEQMAPAARSFADVGAGSGAFAAEAQRRGHRVAACEHSRIGRWMARRQGVDSRPFDLARSPPALLGRPSDLAYCFEVAEHVPPGLAERLVAFVAGHAPLVVFSAAQPGQGGLGHVNEQPEAYWIARFEDAGMRHRADLTASLRAALAAAGLQSRWLVDNVMVFERAG
jgi:glycogen synthase